MQAKTKRGAKIAAMLLCICVLVFNSINIAIGTLGLREQLTWMPIALSQVTSDSMVPMFETGDMLILVETPYAELAVGDVVTFHQGDQLVTHQIIATSGARFITQGIANNKADTTLMGQEEYCATLAYVIPGFGAVLDFFSGAWEIGCLLIFVVVALYGKVFLEWIFAKKEEDTAQITTKQTQLKSKSRLLITLTCLSTVLLTPSLTTAKYVAQINEYTMLSAGSLHFTSNYLSTEGNSYSVSGWQGGEYELKLEIRSYSNDLLYNMDDQDVEYGLYIVPISEDPDDSTQYGSLSTDGTDGAYTLTPKYTTSALGEGLATYIFPEEIDADLQYGPFLLPGDDVDKMTHTFSFTVEGTEFLEVGDQIRFQIWAETAREGQFYMEQWGDFQFTRGDASDFIDSAEKDISGSLITYTVKSNALEQESTSKDVTFYWDPDKLYINQFETTAYQIIVNDTDGSNYSRDEGWITVTMKDYTSVALQFFIRSGYTSDDIGENDLYYIVEGDIVDLDDETNPDEQTTNPDDETNPDEQTTNPDEQTTNPDEQTTNPDGTT